eukprot:RCo022924
MEGAAQKLTGVPESDAKEDLELELAQVNAEEAFHEAEAEAARAKLALAEEETRSAEALAEEARQERAVVEQRLREGLEEVQRLRLLYDALISASSGAAQQQQRSQFLQKIRGILNKVAPEKYAVLLDQLWGVIEDALVEYLEISDLLHDVVAVVFEVALDQPNYCNLHACLFFDVCERFRREACLEMRKYFRRILLVKCQHLYEEGMSHVAPDTSEMSEDERERANFEEQRFRRQTLGNVRFIAELYKHDLLTE